VLFLIVAGACVWQAVARPTGWIREILEYPETPPPVEVPKEVTDYIRTELGARLVDKTDYPSDIFETNQNHVRWIVKSDFDGNGMEDHAVLIRKDQGGFMVVAIHVFKSGMKHYILDEELEGNLTGSTLMIQPVGLTSVSMADEVPPQTKDLRNPGIVESELETCHTVLYYWEDGEYHGVYRGL
jgi:hypothetical protein